MWHVPVFIIGIISMVFAIDSGHPMAAAGVLIATIIAMMAVAVMQESK